MAGRHAKKKDIKNRKRHGCRMAVGAAEDRLIRGPAQYEDEVLGPDKKGITKETEHRKCGVGT